MVLGKRNIIKYTNFSGGATGADTVFELDGEKYEISTVAYSFNGHNTTSKNRYILSQDELDEGFKHIEIANKTLKRDIDHISKYVKNLLSRNWFQVKNAEAIFAIGRIKNKMGIRREVDGGTGWAVQIGIDNNKKVYVFDQNTNKWYEWCKDQEPCDKFILLKYIPPLTENFAGIGTRELNENGKKAIQYLLKNNFNFLEP